MTFTQKVRLGLHTVLRVVRNAVFLRFDTNIRLNLGAGGTRMAGYTNVDSLFMRETDLLCELKNMRWFVRDTSVTHIYAAHVLEHFTVPEVRRLLALAYKLLSTNGEIRISVPDFEKIAALYTANREEFRKKDSLSWLGVVYGGQTDSYDFHKTGYTPTWLRQLLTEAGFKEIEEYDAEIFLAPYGVRDSSLYRKDFGDYISLNMVARKL